MNNTVGLKAAAILGLAAVILSFAIVGASKADTAINGNVQSRCIISTDTEGTFGNPNAYTLDTATVSGGELAVTRFDVTLADAYYAQITAPSSFSSNPSLPDVVTWTGDTTVKAVSDSTGMSAYETNKIETGYMDKYDMTATGSTWFKTQSKAVMGGSKSFAGGSYTALVVAECIAQ